MVMETRLNNGREETRLNNGREETRLNNGREEATRLGRSRKADPDRSAVGVVTKYLLFLENFLAVILGLCLTGLGTYILVIKEKRVHDAIDFFLDPACDMVLAGGVVLVMAFFGCMGALREITCFLKFYYFALCVILLVELSLATLMFVSYYIPEVKTTMFPTAAFNKAIVGYRDDLDMQDLIDTMQKDLECCGLSDDNMGFMDWNENMYFNCSNDNQSPERCSVPYSCCITKKGDKINFQCGANVISIKPDGSVTPNTDNTGHIYTKGCVKALGDWINEHALVVGGVILGILLPQIFIVVLSRNLIDMIKIQKSKW